jgi:UDP-N-acetyl-2-amino-2-deoxyglucuronate dehydrogenase
MTKLGFALVGCGRISKKYTEILTTQMEEAGLTAVCDLNPEKAESVGKKFGVPFYLDMHEMIKEMKDQIDVICILTPSGNHAQNVVDLAGYGKHLVVEKPMALTLTDADRMIKICDQNGVKLFVVKQNRYNLPVQKLREAVEAERFGRIVMGTVRVRWCRRQEYYDQDAWRGTWAMDGGVFTNQASHHVDLLEWMLGEVESVFAKSSTALVDIETEDTGVAVLRFKNGSLGIIEATTATRPKDLEGSLSVLGEKGTVEIGGFAVNQLKTWNFLDQSETEQEQVLAEYRENPPNVYGFGHVAYLKNVVDTILHKNTALVDGLEGRKSLELISAIYESIETGKEVFLSFTPQKCRLGLKQ